MTHFGTFEGDTDFDLVATLQDQGGTAVDLSVGGSATVTVSVERKGAVYIDDAAVTNTTEASGIVTWSATDTVSIALPAGTLDVIFKAVMGGGAVRRWRGTMTIVRGAGL